MPWELPGRMDSDYLRQGLRDLDTDATLSAAVEGIRSGNGRVSALELSFYMRNQLLRDSDWAGMAHSLEIRTPLVDYELLRRLAPAVAGFAGPSGKLALAQAPQAGMPSTIVQRTKSGFGVPTAHWTGNAATRGGHRSKGGASRDWSAEVYAASSILLPASQTLTAPDLTPAV